MPRDSLWRDNGYLRKSAVMYAVKYALKPNPYYRYFKVHGDGGGDCSNFISQCLHAGGAPFDFGTYWPWWYKNNGSLNVYTHTWSISWALAHSLYWCLKSRGRLGIKGLKGFEVTDIGMLDLGDMIQYENRKGIIYHSAIITSFETEGGMKVPLISQHSYDMLNVSYIKPAASKMHFMKIVL